MKKVFIESMNACFANEQEGEKLKSFFAANGWGVVPNAVDADLIVFNGCAFDRAKEDWGLSRIQELQKQKANGAQMIISGCLPGINPERLGEVFQGTTITAKSFDRFDELFQKDKSIRSFKTVSNRKDRYLLQIATGCLGNCTFCGIKKAIGDIQSRSIDEIRREFQLQLADGVQHFVLASHDFGAFGRDRGESAPKLLRELLKVSGDYQLELDWMDPYWMHRSLDDYIEILQDRRIRRAFFMPLQSGNDRILGLMGRKYNTVHFRHCVKTLLEKVSDFEPQTEVIVGFPTETDDEFQDTLKMLGEFPFCNIQYYPFDAKPNTKAETMDGRVPEEVKQGRITRIRAFVHKSNYLWRQLKGIESHIDKTEISEIRQNGNR